MTITDDTFSGPPTQTGDTSLPTIPALTIVWHPQVDRIGQIAPLDLIRDRTGVALNREHPIFSHPGSTNGIGLDHQRVSLRTAHFEVRPAAQGVELVRGPADEELLINGRHLESSHLLTPDDLRAGVILTINGRIVLCLHLVLFPVSRTVLPPHLASTVDDRSASLIGTSDAIEHVRRAIQRVADSPVTVLVRGETGTGKELVARALHFQSHRRDKNFIAVNMAQVRPELAASLFFGHERAAFTGAGAATLGHFRNAHGGTLFLDEIHKTHAEVQPILLRVLQDRHVQPVGSSHSHLVDTRVVVASEPFLEDAVAAGRFDRPLYHRLSAQPINLPSLRARREDFGALFLHFLRGALRAVGALSRLDDPSAEAHPWLPPRLIADLARGPWPGNVRELEHLAGQIARSSPTDPHPSLKELTLPFMPPRNAAPSLLPTRALSLDALLVALQRNDWNQTHTAKALNISRETLRKLIKAQPALRRVIEIDIADLVEELRRCGGDRAELSRKLGIDEPILLRRLPPS